MPGTFRRRVWVKDLNPNLICVLCGGYFIDATTLTECLHSFCKTCIIEYLETSKNCPVCDVLVHKTRPHLNLRSDKTLQDLVYKMIPGLYKAEMKRRRDYYAEHPDGAPLKMGEARGDENAERILYSKDDKFSVALYFCSRGVKDEWSVRTLSLPEVTASSQEPEKSVRYLQCPAGVTVLILKRFVRHKYDLSAHYHVDIFHSDEALCDEYTLIDVAYIYTWRRKEPLKLCFSVYELLTKRRKIERADNPRLLDIKRWMKEESKAADSKGDLSQTDPKKDHLKAADVSCDLKPGQVKQETDHDAGQQSQVQTCAAMCPDEQKADQKGCKRKFGAMEDMDVKFKGEVSSATPALARTVTATSTFVPPVSQPESKAAAPSQLVEEKQAEEKKTLQVKKGDITPHTAPETPKVTGVTGATKESSQPCQTQPQKLAPAQPAPSSVPLTSPTPPAPASQSGKKAVKRSCPQSWVVTTVSPSKKKSGVLPGQVSLLPVVSLPVLKAGGTLQAVADPAHSSWAETVPRAGSAVKGTDGGATRVLLPQQKDISGTATQTVAMTSQQVSKLLMSQQASKAQTLQAARTLTSLQTSTGSLQAPKTLAAKPQLAPAKVHMSVQASESPMLGHVMPRVVTASPGAKVLQASKGLMTTLPTLKSRPQVLIDKKANTAGQKQQRLKESKTFAVSIVSSSASAPSISATAPSTSSSVQSNTANVKPCSVSLPLDCAQRASQHGSVSSTKSASPALLSAPSLSAPQASTQKPQISKSTESSSSASRPVSRPVAADSDALSVPVSRNSSVPSAAAAAAGAASPSPAALAASSSPSPPMASSAASVREEAEAVSKCLVSASGCPVTPTLSASSGSLTVQQRSSAQQQKGVTVSSLQSAVTEKVGDHKTVKVARSEPVPPSSGISQSANQTAVSAHSQTSKCEVPSLSQSQSCTATQNTTTTTPVSNNVQSAQSVRAVQRASEAGSIAGTTVTVTEMATTKGEAVVSTKPEDQKELSQGNPSTTNTDKSVKSANPATLNEGNVLTARVPHAGIQTKPQTPAKLDTPKTAGFKVLAVSRATTLPSRNGMPTVVTRPTRVINASTSVNTLCHKLPVSSNTATTPGQRPPVSVSISSQKLHGTTTTTVSSSSSTPSAKGSTCTVTTLTHKLPPASSTSVSAPSSKPTTSGTTVATPSLAKPVAGTSIATPSLTVSAGLTAPSQSKGVASSTVSAAASSHKVPVTCAVVSGTTGSVPVVSGAASASKPAVTSPPVSNSSIIPVTKPTVTATSAVSGVVSAKSESSAAVTAVSCEPAVTATTVSSLVKPAAATATPVSTTPIVTCTSVSAPVSKPTVTCVGVSTPAGKPAVTCTPVVSQVRGTVGSSGLKSCSVPLMDIKQLALTRSNSLPHLSSSSSCTSAAVTVPSTVHTSTAPSVQASSASSPKSVTKSVSSPPVGDSKQSSNVSVDMPKPSPNPSGKAPSPSSSRAEVKPCSTVTKIRPQSACTAVTSTVKLAPNTSKAVSLGHGASKSQTLSTSQATKASSSLSTTSSSAHQAANSLTPRSGTTYQTPGRSGQGGSHTVSKAVAPLKHHPSAKSPGSATSQAVGKPFPISSLAAASCPKGSSLMPVPLQSLVLAGGSVGEVVEGLSPLTMATMAQRANQIQQAFTLQQALQQAKQQQQQQQHAKQHEQQQQQMREFQQYQFLQQQQQQIMNMRAVAALAAGYPLQTSALLAASPLQVGAVLGAMCPPTLSPLQPPSSTDGAKKQMADSSKKQTSDGSAKKATSQATAAAVPAGKKGGESSGKKKISDIANSLHRKVSQTAGGETGGGKTSASAEQRPPVAHSSSTATATSTSSSSSSRPRTDDEQPLNLVTRSGHEEKSGN